MFDEDTRHALPMCGDGSVGALRTIAPTGNGEIAELTRSFRAEPFAAGAMLRRTGDVVSTPPLATTDDPVVCQCMRVTRSTLVNALEGPCQTAQGLSMRTGAGTVCGGC